MVPAAQRPVSAGTPFDRTPERAAVMPPIPYDPKTVDRTPAGLRASVQPTSDIDTGAQRDALPEAAPERRRALLDYRAFASNAARLIRHGETLHGRDGGATGACSQFSISGRAVVGWWTASHREPHMADG